MEIPNHPTAYTLIIVATTMLSTSIIQWTFLIKLKRNYHSQWVHAGRPTIWSDQSFMSAWPTINYLQNEKYYTSGNRQGAEFCNKFRGPMVFGYWLTIFIFVVGIAVTLIKGWPPEWS